MSTLRETGTEALRIVRRLRDMAAEVDGTERSRNVTATHLRRLAYELEITARTASVQGVRLMEPEPEQVPA